jgi:hypothetical protein
MTSQNQSQSSPKNMLDFAKMVKAQSVESPQQTKQTQHPVDTGITGDEVEAPQAPTEQPKNMLDFAKMVKAQLPQETKDMPEKETEEPRAGGFERSRVRAMEAVAGMPGEFVHGVAAPLGHYVGKGIEAVTGKKVPEEALYGAASVLPTAEDIKKFHEKYTGEYYKAQTPGEIKSDELVQDASRIGAGLLMSGGAKTGMDLLKKVFMITGGGQAGKEGAKALGYGEEEQEYAKLGSQMLMSLFNPKLGKDLAQKYYAEADRMPKAVKGNARPLISSLREELNWSKSHADTADKAFIRSMLEPLHKEISQTGRLSFQDAREFLRSMNRNAEKLYELPSSSRKLARAKIDSIRAKFDPFLKQGNQYMPGWYENVKAGNQIYGAIEGSRGFSKFVKEHHSSLIKAGVPTLMLDHLASHALLKGGGLFGYPAYEASKIGYKMYRSPLLAKAYADAVVAAGANNLPAVANSLRKLDREINKEQED